MKLFILSLNNNIKTNMTKLVQNYRSENGNMGMKTTQSTVPNLSRMTHL